MLIYFERNQLKKVTKVCKTYENVLPIKCQKKITTKMNKKVSSAQVHELKIRTFIQCLEKSCIELLYRYLYQARVVFE